MNKLQKFTLIALVLLALTASAFYLPRAIMVYSGYCLSEERYLSPQEKIDRAISQHIISAKQWGVRITDYELNEAGEKIESKRVVVSYPYADLEEFYALNPDCCFFFNEYDYGGIRSSRIPLRKRLHGQANPPYLYINYIAAFDWKNNNEPIYIGNHYMFHNCGAVSENPYAEVFFHD